MLFSKNFSDYESGKPSIDSTMSFNVQEAWSSCQSQKAPVRPQPRKATSYIELVLGRHSLEEVMMEFRMNGVDSPYTPDEDTALSHLADEMLIGMGPSSAYLRQKSWPEPERTPAPRLPRWSPIQPEFTARPPVEVPAPRFEEPEVTRETITEEQMRVLTSLPNNLLYALLRGLEKTRGGPRQRKLPEECRFCKNNGERESYYRSHTLKDSLGLVACPVLRAFQCKRCGATGDTAHTLKYCPLSTSEERVMSKAMMRSVRMASGRRRAHADGAPLDPLWAELERKLL